ncbi:MAG: hypothetical protein ACLFUI_10420, partial [Halanaerobiales bacterium]
GRFNMVNFYDFFKLILDIHKDGSLFPGATSLGNDPLRAQFAAGNIGMFMAESWDVGVLNDQFPAECEWGVAVAPTVSGEFEGRTRAMSSPGLWSINGMSQHKEEAWEVVKWYNQYEVRARFYEEGKFIPPDPEVITHATKVPDITGFAAFAETVEDFDYVTGYPQYPGFVNPPENPCDVMSAILSKNGSADDLKAELERVDKLWNDALDEYYEEHPEAERGWNIYPDFNRVTGEKGDPQVSL